MPALVARVFCNFQVSKSEQKNFDQERKKFSETLYSPFFFFFYNFNFGTWHNQHLCIWYT